MDISILIARFRQWFGHTDFHDEKVIRGEHTYKYKRGQRMLEWLHRETLHQLIEEERWDEICDRVLKSFSISSGPLARWSEYQWVRELEGQEQKRFALALEAFLYGQRPFLERLEHFVAEATDVYLHFREQDPNVPYKAKKLSWPVIIHLIGLVNPQYVG